MEEIKTWVDLNAFIRTADEQACLDLLELEKKGSARKQFMLRIHSRMNKIRAGRERQELIQLSLP